MIGQDQISATAVPAAATSLGRNPYVFVVGCLRSGTTLLQRMLDSHPLLAVGYDSHFIPKAIRGVTGTDPTLTPELVERVRTHRRFARLGLSDAAVDRAAAGAETYAEFVSALYTAYGRQRGKPLAGEKSPGYCRHLPLLHVLFPYARTLHIIRDGRDIALSVLDWRKGPAKLDLWREEPIAATALWWRRDVLAGRAGGQQLGSGAYREIRYEQLVTEPAATMHEVAAFLHLPFDQAMVDYNEGKTRVQPGRSAKASWLPATPGLRDWRRQMEARDVELFEAIAGDLLDELGYERRFPRVARPIAEVAERCERWWIENEETGSKRHRGPRAAAPSARRRSESPNPFVFMVGCPRSGTTMLRRMVSAHSEIAITPETHWIPRFFRKRTGVTEDGLVAPDLVSRLFDYHKFLNLKLDRADVEALVSGEEPLAYADFVSGIFDLYARREGKPLVGDKTPGYVRDLPVLHALWPEARFVHLVRDGRDVCLSMLDWDRAHRTVGHFRTWEDDRVTTTALWWEWFVRLGRDFASAIGGERYLEVRYETLVADPAAQCRELCRFFGVPFEEAMVNFHEGKTRDAAGLSAKRAWLPVTAGLRDWRTQLPPDDIERFEAAAGDLLDELGYERAFPVPGAAALDHASSLRDRFIRDPHYKERWQPKL